jgi:hypothetical protein
MKQASALLALVVTGSLSAGCGTCDPAETVIDWTFTDAAGQTTTSCAAAGVATFRIFVNGHPQLDPRQDLPCADYATGAIIPAETNRDQIQIEAYDASGNLLYTSNDTVASRNGCGLTAYHANLQAQFGDLTLVYALQGGACTTPTAQSSSRNTYIWFELLDANGNVFSVVDRTHDQTAIPCGASSNTIVIPSVPFGNYRLNGIQEVEIRADTSFIVYQYNCVPTVLFQHTQPNDVITAPAMVSQPPGGTTTCF